MITFFRLQRQILSTGLALTLGSITVSVSIPAFATADQAGTSASKSESTSAPAPQPPWEEQINAKLDAGDVKGVLALCEQALKENPRNEKALYFRAVAKFLGHEPLLVVLEDLNMALEINPRFVDALFGRGRVSEMLHDYKTAIADYSAILAIDPKNSVALESRINVHSTLGDIPGLVDDFTHRISV
ncbi:MAG TPA: hypothetical protein V6D08_09990, partial [Candidatus Obscuribacterales bacterium]